MKENTEQELLYPENMEESDQAVPPGNGDKADTAVVGENTILPAVGGGVGASHLPQEERSGGVSTTSLDSNKTIKNDENLSADQLACFENEEWCHFLDIQVWFLFLCAESYVRGWGGGVDVGAGW
jgi:hypothetical protein